MSVKATKLPSGNWRCKANYTDIDGTYRSKSFTAATKKEAEYSAAAFLMDMKHKKKPANRVIGELVDVYLDNRTNVLSPSTMAGYRKIRRTAFTDIMGARAGFITQQMYQSSVNEYAKGRSPKTVNEAHRLICRVFKENHIDIDESAVILPQMVRTEIKIPTTDEVRQILEAGAKKDIYLPILLAALLGLRKSEILALTWEDIDIENSRMRINKASVKDEYGTYITKTTKTASSTRTLSMPPQIIEALPPRGLDKENVIAMRPDTFYSRYKRIVAKLGFDYNFHSLRHYCASVMLQNNIPDKYAMEKMGHATSNMLKKVYQHTFADAHKEYDNVMIEFFKNNGI